MSDTTKYRVCRVASIVAVVVGVICLSQMSPWVSTHRNKIVFGVLIADVVVGLGTAIGYYYYRAKLRNANIDNVAVPTLAATAKQIHTQK